MLSIFVEASCNRYERDECLYCHVFEPLTQMPKSDWHITSEQAQTMAEKISQVDVLLQLATQEINLTGGEATFNPEIVNVFKAFQKISPNVCIHTNLEISSENSPRWKRLLEIIKLKGRVDITLYPKAWEKSQKPLFIKLLELQNRMLVNVVFESIEDLKTQLEILIECFQELGNRYAEVLSLLKKYHSNIIGLIKDSPDCRENQYTQRMGDTGAFAQSNGFIFGINLLPAFKMDEAGHRALTSNPFPNDPYLLECVAARGSIDILTVQQNGNMTPCCDVGNLKCVPTFGNLLKDSPEKITACFEESRKIIASGIAKNRHNLQNNQAGGWVEEGIPPYCI